jgi:RHS repeat-associated protein
MSEFRRTPRGTYVPEWTKHYVYLGDRMVALRENLIASPPGGLTAATSVSGTIGYVDIFWLPNPASDGVPVTTYHLYRALQSATPAYQLVATTSDTEYTDTVVKGTWYQYVVTADDGTRPESYPSDPLVIRANLLNPKPNAPLGLTARPADLSVGLTWNASNPSENVTGYHVYRRVGSSTTRLTQALLVYPSFVDRTVTAGVSYNYSLSATNTVGQESLHSAEVAATAGDYVPPGLPMGLRVIPACDGTFEVSLSWSPSDPSGSIASYVVFREPSFTGGSASISVGLQTSFVDTDTSQSTQYYYRVKSLDANQNISEASLRVGVMTRTAPGTIPVPAAPVALAGDGKVSLRITALPSVRDLRLYRKRNVDLSCDSFELVKVLEPTSQEYTDGNVPNNVAYDYALTGVDAANHESAFSSAALGIPLAAPYGFTECTEDLGPKSDTSNWREGAGICDPTDQRFKRLALRWQPPAAEPYQPFSGADTTGTLGYLRGYRIYRYSTPATLSEGLDLRTLEHEEVDASKKSCQDHPNVSCWDSSTCPGGGPCITPAEGQCEGSTDSCLGDYATDPNCGRDRKCLRWSGYCVPSPLGLAVCSSTTPCLYKRQCVDGKCQLACNVDADCDGVQQHCSAFVTDPTLTSYQDAGENFLNRWPGDSRSYIGSCLAAKAVYKVFAHGAWRTVESGFSDNFDPSRTDGIDRCRNTTQDFCTELTQRSPCPTLGVELPVPPAPSASSSAANEIMLTWDPPKACLEASPEYCDSSDYHYCDPARDQFCRIDSLDGLSGHCQFNNPKSCMADSDCVPPLTCQSREAEIDGYYIYAAGETSNRYHFKPPFPVATKDATTREHTFKNLGPSSFSFQVASFDRAGRISRLSPVSNRQSPIDAAVPVPGGVKAVIWATADPVTGADAIKVMWRPVTTAGATYRLWRATAEEGPYSVLTNTSGRSFLDSTVLQGTTYYYRVTAMLSPAVESSPSATIKAQVLPHVSNPLSPPASFKAEAPKGITFQDGATEWAGIYLSWCPNPAREAVTSYRVYRSTTSMGPYSAANWIATVPPSCLDWRNRCEITGSTEKDVLLTTTSCHKEGVGGTCRLIDKKTVPPSTSSTKTIYYYVVTAVRGSGASIEESGLSTENQGRPNYNPGDAGATSWDRRFDPDNFPDVSCGDEISSLGHDQPAVAESGSNSEDAAIAESQPVNLDPQPDPLTVAPYRSIGQAAAPILPNAVPKFIFYQLDHLGSPRVITDETGAVVSTHHYMPFGDEAPVQAQTSTNKRQFTGHERDDDTGHDYMLARYYSSSLGRFMAVDPGDDTRRENPQSWNKYEYVRNNPLRLVDPHGTNALPKPYNVPDWEWNDPCAGMAFCHDFKGGTKQESAKAYEDQEKLRQGLNPKVKRFFNRLLGIDIDKILSPGNGVTIDLDKKPQKRGFPGQTTSGGEILLDMSLLDDPALFRAVLLHETGHLGALYRFGSLSNDSVIWPGLRDMIDAQVAGRWYLGVALGQDGYSGYGVEQLQYGRVETWAH